MRVIILIFGFLIVMGSVNEEPLVYDEIEHSDGL